MRTEKKRTEETHQNMSNAPCATSTKLSAVLLAKCKEWAMMPLGGGAARHETLSAL